MGSVHDGREARAMLKVVLDDYGRVNALCVVSREREAEPTRWESGPRGGASAGLFCRSRRTKPSVPGEQLRFGTLAAHVT
jgi:hypothetical protein